MNGDKLTCFKFTEIKSDYYSGKPVCKAVLLFFLVCHSLKQN